jgi:hypothetical protein
VASSPLTQNSKRFLVNFSLVVRFILLLIVQTSVKCFSSCTYFADY